MKKYENLGKLRIVDVIPGILTLIFAICLGEGLMGGLAALVFLVGFCVFMWICFVEIIRGIFRDF